LYEADEVLLSVMTAQLKVIAVARVTNHYDSISYSHINNSSILFI